MSHKLNTFQRVRELTGWSAVAFSATLVERMLPNYLLFCQISEFDDGKQFRKTMNAIWEWLSQSRSKLNYAVHLEKVELATPDADDFDHYGVYPAIDAAISLSSLLLLMMAEDEQGAVVVSKLSQGSVEAFVEATADEELDNLQIKQHPLMQWEIAFQQELLDSLESMKAGKASALALRQMAIEEGISNIGIEISEND